MLTGVSMFLSSPFISGRVDNRNISLHQGYKLNVREVQFEIISLSKGPEHRNNVRLCELYEVVPYVLKYPTVELTSVESTTDCQIK